MLTSEIRPLKGAPLGDVPTKATPRARGDVFEPGGDAGVLELANTPLT